MTTERIEGAPFQVGDCVKILKRCDETGSNKHLGQVGTVYDLDYHSGCGQSYPADPMIFVVFRTNLDVFWKEELQPAPR